jgi:hypothetical protein
MRKRDAHTYFDDDGICEDGESVRAPVVIMDSDARSHQPHFARLTDDAILDARRTARAAWIKQMNDAWRRPGRDAADADPSEPANVVEAVRRQTAHEISAGEVEARRRAIHAEFSRNLSEAWRGGR